MSAFALRSQKPGVEKEVWMFDKRTYVAYEDQLKVRSSCSSGHKTCL